MPFTRPHPVRRPTRLIILTLAALALAGCQGIGSQFAQVRFIDASPDSPALDAYQNSTAIAYNLGFGTVTSYIFTAPASYAFSLDTAGSQQQLAALHAALLSGGQYTVLAGNVAAGLQLTLLKDQAQPAPSGEVALRLLDQSTRTGPVDIYLVPAGESLAGILPVASNVSFDNAPIYLDAPARTYSVVVLPTGADPATTTSPLYSGPQALYPSGSARTLVLIDVQPASSTALQIITADDYDPPTATV